MTTYNLNSEKKMNWQEAISSIQKYSGIVKEHSSRIISFRDCAGSTIKNSLEDCLDLDNIITEVNMQMEKANQGVNGMNSLVKYQDKNQRVPLTKLKENPMALEILQDKKMENRHGLLTKLPWYNNTISVDKALTYILQGLKEIPAHMDKSQRMVEESYNKISQYKSSLRGKINEINTSRRGLDQTLTEVEINLKGFEKNYDSLEEERREVGVKGHEFDQNKLYQMEELESLVGEYGDCLNQINLVKDESSSLIKLINSQISKLGNYQDLVQDALKVVREGKAYIDVQVPYAITEVEGQRAMGMSLVTTNSVINFLKSQSDASKKYNLLIQDGIEKVRANTQEFKKIITNPEILPEEKYIEDKKGNPNSLPEINYFNLNSISGSENENK